MGLGGLGFRFDMFIEPSLVVVVSFLIRDFSLHIIHLPCGWCWWHQYVEPAQRKQKGIGFRGIIGV